MARGRVLLLCAWIAIFGLDLCAAARPRYGGTLRLSFSQTAETYDPVLAATLPERLVSRAVYETLVSLNLGDAESGAERGAAAPGLAVGWQSELGGKRWVFQLRAGVRFHNSALLNAAVARASLERAVARAQTAAAAHLRRLQFLCASPAPNRLACDMAEPVALPELLADPALAITDADGAGTGPWKVAAWMKGARIRLEAFDAYPQGRPFLDAIEAEFGADPRRQRADFELRRVDAIVAGPTEARIPGLERAAPPTNLLLLGFHSAGAFARSDGGSAARRALAALDRDTLARLLPPGRADAAEAFLPGWVSGYEFLFGRGFRGASRTGAAATLPRGPLRLIYDDTDSLARLIASRLVLDLRAAGLELRPEGLPRPGFAQARETGQYDLFLESVPLRVENPAAALAELYFRYDGEKVPAELFRQMGRGSSSVELQYRLEQNALDELRAIPLVHHRDQYSFQPGLAQVRLDENGMLDLANAWKQR